MRVQLVSEWDGVPLEKAGRSHAAAKLLGSLISLGMFALMIVGIILLTVVQRKIK